MPRLSSIAVALLALRRGLYASAEPVPAPRIPSRLDARLFGGDLSFCFGSGSICEVSLDLSDECDGLMDDIGNLDPWYTCLCGNGYVSVDDACYYCQLAYHLDVSWNGPMFTEACESIGATIAPIPSSVLSRESRYNATYTGIISGAGSATHTGSVTSTTTAATSNDDGPTTSTARVSASTTAPKSTFFGGTTAVETLGGGNTPETTGATTARSTAAQTTTAGAGVGTGAASSGSIPVILAVSLVFMGVVFS